MGLLKSFNKKGKPVTGTEEARLNAEIHKIWPEWQIVALLGEGSYGKVYEINRRENGKLYRQALKVITVPQSQSDIDYVSDVMSQQNVTSYFTNLVKEITREYDYMNELGGRTNIVNYYDHNDEAQIDFNTPLQNSDGNLFSMFMYFAFLLTLLFLVFRGMA